METEVVTLSPNNTGLNLFIRIYSYGNAEPYIRVSNDYIKYNYKDTFDVSLKKPYSIIGRSTINENELELLYEWIDEHYVALMKVWCNELFYDTREFY